jgi:NAD-dependent dihydropyrimidine dehydrogenase PreA subunit
MSNVPTESRGDADGARDETHSADAAKARRAARHPERPGEKCRAPTGRFRPEVDVRRCEGKGDCVAVCPYDVFEVGRVSDETFRTFSPLAKLKSWAHGRKTAFTPNADACRACGLCVVACPERAIRLVQ